MLACTPTTCHNMFTFLPPELELYAILLVFCFATHCRVHTYNLPRHLYPPTLTVHRCPCFLFGHSVSATHLPFSRVVLQPNVNGTPSSLFCSPCFVIGHQGSATAAGGDDDLDDFLNSLTDEAGPAGATGKSGGSIDDDDLENFLS